LRRLWSAALFRRFCFLFFPFGVRRFSAAFVSCFFLQDLRKDKKQKRGKSGKAPHSKGEKQETKAAEKRNA
jgi:hypothetical protein